MNRDELKIMLESVNEVNELINKQVNDYSDSRLITDKRNLFWNIRTQIGILNEMMETIEYHEKEVR